MTYNLVFFQVAVPEEAVGEFQKVTSSLLGIQIKRDHRRKRQPPEVQAEIRRLYGNEGLTLSQIGEQFALSPTTVKEYVRGIKRKKTPSEAEAKPKRPVGRPRLTPDEKKVRTVGYHILGYYSNLKERFSKEDPGLYEQEFSLQERCLLLAIKENDIDTVLWFEANRPWIKGKAAEDPPNRRKLQQEENTPS